MFNVLVGGAIIAAFVAGVVALFAPCCISVMLPAYLATTFRQRRALVAMTFIFGLGVATIILPIALGASVISRFIRGDHMLVFLVGVIERKPAVPTLVFSGAMAGGTHLELEERERLAAPKAEGLEAV